ncbi:photoreceptor-specific nuclear receptor-like [Dendronephthya gigantea]|uniref:photoreceptor-specific nuclear receptor-like n=1 Tax=Dendronephthya gigantea TaxID=151771 RepID=UPI00106C4514|nr:photoreceptor-specific nuclear receptor-like [Dendronephthya gigantea]
MNKIVETERGNPPCKVCGDRSSGKHYGVQSCDGCRGFFKRSVRRKLTYQCRERGICPIDVARRNQCQSCRLRRCFEAGMNKDAVQHERTPRQQHKDLPGLMFNMYKSSRPQKRKNSEIQNNQLKIKTKKEPQRSPSFSEGHQTDSSLSPNSPLTVKEIVYESSMRILYVSIQWVKHMPTFQDLPHNDQSLLLHRGWCEVFLLGLLQWNLPVDIDAWMTSVGCQTSASGNGKYLMEIHDLQNVVSKLRVAMPDPTELSCAKAIAFFKPELKGLHDPWHVEQLQDQAQCMLGEHIRQQRPEEYVRFGRLLLLIPQLSKINTSLVERMFFQSSAHVKPMDKLINEIFNVC